MLTRNPLRWAAALIVLVVCTTGIDFEACETVCIDGPTIVVEIA